MAHGLLPGALDQLEETNLALVENPLGTLLEHVLKFHDQRHDLIAGNIANANTPGYRAFDIVLDEQLSNGDGPAAHGSLEVSRAPARLDGNNVSIDREFVKLTHNRVMYQVAFELMDRWGNLNAVARDLR